MPPNIVLFITDQSDAAASQKHFEKSSTMHDEAFRISILAKVPCENLTAVPECVQLMDMMPTFYR